MSRPSSVLGKKGGIQNGDQRGQPSVFTCSTLSSAAVQPETRLLSAFKKDAQEGKVFLAGREYFGEEGQTFELRLVGKIKQQLSADPTLRPEYPSPLGLTEFTRQATKIALGKSSKPVLENRVLEVQTPGFTAAVRLGAELLRHRCDVSSAWCGPVYLSSPCDDKPLNVLALPYLSGPIHPYVPTWPLSGSLAGIFQAAGIHDVRQYYYWDDKQRGICLEKFVEDLESAPEQSVVVLSASGHYPTGADVSESQWDVITQMIKGRRLFPFFLLPVQALSTGDLERDAKPIQKCAALGMELICAQSFSHCFGQYGEAVGHLFCVLKHNSFLLAMQSQAKKTVKSLWAQPSVMGAQIVATILSNPAHFVEWQEEIKHIVERCMLIRQVLRERLRHLGTPGFWDHLTQQRGLFCCTGLTGPQLEFLWNSKHVYLLPNGCLNVSAINGRNLEYVAESIHQAVTTSL